MGARAPGISLREEATTDATAPFHKYDHVCCVDFRFWRGATREHPPKWGCDRGATKPEPKSDATLRATVLFGPGSVAHALQTPEGYARRSRLVWAKNPSPQTWLYLWNGVLSVPVEVGPGLPKARKFSYGALVILLKASRAASFALRSLVRRDARRFGEERKITGALSSQAVTS